MEKIDAGITQDIRDHLIGMTYGAIPNYILPGMWSGLVGEGHHSSQKVRIFQTTRTQDMPITPHSHRFDLACMVLNGWVENTIYTETDDSSAWGDPFFLSLLKYGGSPGEYEKEVLGPKRYARVTKKYLPGQWYFMAHEAIHSIVFGRDTALLLIEGDSKTDSSLILEPNVYGKHVETFQVHDWMFKA